MPFPHAYFPHTMGRCNSEVMLAQQEVPECQCMDLPPLHALCHVLCVGSDHWIQATHALVNSASVSVIGVIVASFA